MSASPKDTNAENAKPHPVESFAATLQLFWLKNRNAILALCFIILLGVLGRELYFYIQEQRAIATAKEYAACGSSSDKLKQFASSNEGNALASVAYLRLADEAYIAGKYPDALGFYEKSLKASKEFPFAGRAALGAAMSQVQAGKSAEGQTALRSIVDNAAQLKGVRAEAAYHLATLLIDAGKTEDAKKLVDQILQVDSAGVWAQRALMLRASLAGPAAPAADSAASGGLVIPGASK
jgi:predicted negative regulator of RcsB-dependent stress response